MASLDDDGVYLMDEGHHTGDVGRDGDGDYEDHHGECEEGSDNLWMKMREVSL